MYDCAIVLIAGLSSNVNRCEFWGLIYHKNQKCNSYLPMTINNNSSVLTFEFRVCRRRKTNQSLFFDYLINSTSNLVPGPPNLALLLVPRIN